MKSITRHIAILIAAIAAGTGLATGQMLKLNAPLTLGGSPNLGYGHQFNNSRSRGRPAITSRRRWTAAWPTDGIWAAT